MPLPSTDNFPVLFGSIHQSGQLIDFRATEEVLQTHMAIFGGTRYGKSKLFELLCRQLLLHDRGFAFIDPHSDTADDLLAYLSSEPERLGFISKKVHYLKPGDRLFSFDPFRYTPDPDDASAHSDHRYRSWLCTKVKDMAGVILRPRGETEDEQSKTVRRSRWLENALYAIGMRQDERGTHLSITDAIPLLKPQHGRHNEVYDRVRHHLDPNVDMDAQVLADLDMLHNLSSPRQQEDFTESTINALRRVFSSPTTSAIFNQTRPSIDFHGIVQRGDIILASLGKTTEFHEEEGQVIAGLLIRQITEAIRTVDRTQRRQFYLYMDEAQNFLGDDLIRLLKESAKYKLSVGLAVQSLDNLQKGEVDLVPTVLGQCGIRITFRQQHHESAEVLAKCLCNPLLDFTELLQEVDRDDGYDFVLMPSETRGVSDTNSLSTTHSFSYQVGTSKSHGTTISDQHSASYGNSRSETDNATSQFSTSEGKTHAKGKGKSKGTTQQRSESNRLASMHDPLRTHSESGGTTDTESMSESDSDTQQSSRGGSIGHSQTLGNTTTTGHTHGRAVTDTTTESETFGESDSDTTGYSQSRSYSVTLARTPLHRTRVEIIKTGSLERSVPDQIAKQTNLIQSLEKQHCLASVALFNSAFVLRVADVHNAFHQRHIPEDWKQRAIQNLKTSIFDRHPYYFAPDSTAGTMTRIPDDLTDSDDPFLPSEE